ncbi:unnamed protein product [Darwinula stevensoni]|uniref:Uncharacterized protein n=1 Tax=Darwinula stevensoni TaxID=69355 RepID=A0A7R9A6A7_9CRUS|nr:unnamed protein product [Darwinula stevensoni]CAG0888565.1 unnamed protein product [Darwinula stevensoni]
MCRRTRKHFPSVCLLAFLSLLVLHLQLDSEVKREEKLIAQQPTQPTLSEFEPCECIVSSRRCRPEDRFKVPDLNASRSEDEDLMGLPFAESVPEWYLKEAFGRRRAVGGGNRTVTYPHCSFKRFRSSETKTCLHARRSSGLSAKFLFVGDSRVRNRFTALLNLSREMDIIVNYNRKDWVRLDDYLYPMKRVHDDIEAQSRKDHGVRFKFLWAPNFTEPIFLYLKGILKVPTTFWPAVVVVGGGMWDVAHLTKNQSTISMEQNFLESLDKLAPLLQSLAKHIPVIWQLQDPIKDWRISRLHRLNTLASSHLSSLAPRVLLWDTTWPLAWEYILACSRLIRAGNAEAQEEAKSWRWWCHDRIHVGFHVLMQYGEILLNLLCNAVMKTDPGDCCRDYGRP